jgi:hypothetical protein
MLAVCELPLVSVAVRNGYTPPPSSAASTERRFQLANWWRASAPGTSSSSRAVAQSRNSPVRSGPNTCRALASPTVDELTSRLQIVVWSVVVCRSAA